MLCFFRFARLRPRHGSPPYQVMSLLTALMMTFSAQADPFLTQVERAGPARRIVLLLNYFDTCTVTNNTRPAVTRLLNTLDELGEREQDDQLSRYVWLIKETYLQSGSLTDAQKAAFCLEAGQRADRNGDARLAAVCQHLAGQYFFFADEFEKAFEHQLAANKAFKKIGYQHFPEISKYLYELAFNYYYFNENEKAIELLKDAAQYPAYNTRLAIQTHNMMGMAYSWVAKQKKPTAFSWAERSYQKARQLAATYNDSVWVGITTGNLANLYENQQKWAAALATFKASYAISLKYGGTRFLPSAEALDIAAIYLRFGKQDSCRFYLNQALTLHQRQPISGNTFEEEHYWRDYYDVARKYYRAVDNLPKAYAYLDSLTVLDKRIDERYKFEQLSLVQQKLLIQKHQSEVEALETEKNRQQILFWIVGVVLTLIASFFFLLYRFVRLKRRQEQVINDEKEKSLRLEKQLVEADLKQATTDLNTFVANLQEKNALIDTITAELEALSQTQRKNHEQDQFVETQQNLLNSSLLTNDDWDEFRRRFERVHPSFFVLLRTQFTDVSPAEERLLALSKLNISTRQMSQMLGISPDSIRKTKYRMHKKLGVRGAANLVELLADDRG